MKQWQAVGKPLVLCLDANENILYRAKLGQQLTDLHGLGMKEVVGDFTGRQLDATFFRGSEPIEAIWAMSNLEVAHACVMPVGYGHFISGQSWHASSSLIMLYLWLGARRPTVQSYNSSMVSR
jgi:hypothetical protein